MFTVWFVLRVQYLSASVLNGSCDGLTDSQLYVSNVAKTDDDYTRSATVSFCFLNGNPIVKTKVYGSAGVTADGKTRICCVFVFLLVAVCMCIPCVRVCECANYVGVACGVSTEAREDGEFLPRNLAPMHQRITKVVTTIHSLVSGLQPLNIFYPPNTCVC